MARGAAVRLIKVRRAGDAMTVDLLPWGHAGRARLVPAVLPEECGRTAPCPDHQPWLRSGASPRGGAGDQPYNGGDQGWDLLADSEAGAGRGAEADPRRPPQTERHDSIGPA